MEEEKPWAPGLHPTLEERRGEKLSTIKGRRRAYGPRYLSYKTPYVRGNAINTSGHNTV
jgi:hypothetical protein